MTNLDPEWWQRAAGMNRKELLGALVTETEAHINTQVKLDAEKRRESVIVACTRAEADLSLKRLGRPTYTPQLRVILTNELTSTDKLRGMKLKNEHVLLVPGWARGKHADEVKEALTISGANWLNCRYAPSPETDRAEGLSNWGRTESAIVDDTLSTLNNLLSRTLERTAEAPPAKKERTWGVIGTT